MTERREVYYFSGTGNSFAVATSIADRLNAELIPIASVAGRKGIESDATVIGITFPVYYADLPNIVKRFADNLSCPEGSYIFGVATYGGAVSSSLKTLDRSLKARGMSLAAGFGVHMPQSAFRKPWENRARIYRHAERRSRLIARSVAARETGMHYSNLFLQILLTPLERFFEKMPVPYMERAANVPGGSGLTVRELIPLVDKSFSTTDACTGCGVCTRVCPVDNIEMVESRPVWRNRCENCLACFNWCPTDAIRGSIVRDSYRYHHPNVTAQDIADQSGQAS